MKPVELTDPQWHLLIHVSQYVAPFYIDFIYEGFCRPGTNKVNFIRMFYRLATLSYIQMQGFDTPSTGNKQTIFYIMTAKGKKVTERFNKERDNEDFT